MRSFRAITARAFLAVGTGSEERTLLVTAHEKEKERLVPIFRMYRIPALSVNEIERTLFPLRHARKELADLIHQIETETAFYISANSPLEEKARETLSWLLAETFAPGKTATESFLKEEDEKSFLFEVGPRLSFTTSWSTNAVSVCHACGISTIERIERSRRFRVKTKLSLNAAEKTELRAALLALFHDRMTEMEYVTPLDSFVSDAAPAAPFEVPLLEEGIGALESLNEKLGLGMDDWDLNYYYKLFTEKYKRNPTSVECFDLAQSNSEHSRHWFFKGRLVVDGEEAPHTLMDLVREPLSTSNQNSIIAFHDNSSALRGFSMRALQPESPAKPTPYVERDLEYHLTFSAETHNFPTGVAPFPGAETGTGGRLRDTHATGKGSLFGAGTAGYSIGNLRIPGYELPWENKELLYPDNLATPLEIEIEASNGASDYGNKFGEPVIQGFTRSFGLRLPDGQRYEYIKPIMFSGGVGQLDARHDEKEDPAPGMLVVKIGGPAYRIGMGGGAASSMIQGDNTKELDFSAVQRGDAEMEQKLNRVIRACVELGDENPIVSIHDQGAGGNCNVVKEIIYPAGGEIHIRNVLLGDHTLSVLEIWGAEYQENSAILIREESKSLIETLCAREKVPFSVIGTVTGSGRIELIDEQSDTKPVDLPLDDVLGKMPPKTFHLDREPQKLSPLTLPEAISLEDITRRVLRLLSVGSKRFLTTKVDRSVTALIAKQQCAGPLHLPVNNVAVVAQSYLSTTGAAIAIGEQPIKGLLSPAAMARMTVGEMLTNMVFAEISDLRDIKCSGNWMWAAKLPGEGVKLYEAALALRDLLKELGVAIDGGKDSLSMAARVPLSSDKGETVKSPGTLTMSGYAPCTDIRNVLSPNITQPGSSKLLYIDLGDGAYRTGGSALAQVFGQVGDTSPDVDAPNQLRDTFQLVQNWLRDGLLLAGHDRSDGGLLTTLLEMAFSGNAGFEVNISAAQTKTAPEVLFAEELGLVLEYLPEHEQKLVNDLQEKKIPWQTIGRTLEEPTIKLSYNNEELLLQDMRELRSTWEETSFQIERLQADPKTAEEEFQNNYDRKAPAWHLSFSPEASCSAKANAPEVAIIREEGSNSDREMANAFALAGFTPWDVTMNDLASGRISLERFRGLAFVGGFSYADVLDSAKGWAGVIRFNKTITKEFRNFYERPDTFSLGVCNGCQLMALLGWVPGEVSTEVQQPRFIRNSSSRFESRFSSVRILESPAMMLRNMNGSALGVWVAHGEGRAYFPESTVLEQVVGNNLAPIRYVDDDNRITERYPFNPNGSSHGIAALCSPDGRHLAMMPHPERTFLTWNWPWMPNDWHGKLAASPWLQLFHNARRWCEEKQ